MNVNYTEGFNPNYGAPAAENIRSFIAGVHEPHETLIDVAPSSMAKMSFMDQDGKLDTEKIYKEAITGGDINYEQRELMRYTMLLEPTKEEVGEIINMIVGKYAEGFNPKLSSRNSHLWKNQASKVFGIKDSAEDCDPFAGIRNKKF